MKASGLKVTDIARKMAAAGMVFTKFLSLGDNFETVSKTATTTEKKSDKTRRFSYKFPFRTYLYVQFLEK